MTRAVTSLIYRVPSEAVPRVEDEFGDTLDQFSEGATATVPPLPLSGPVAAEEAWPIPITATEMNPKLVRILASALPVICPYFTRVFLVEKCTKRRKAGTG